MGKLNFGQVDSLFLKFSKIVNGTVLTKYLDDEVRSLNFNLNDRRFQLWAELDYENNLIHLNLWDYDKRKIAIQCEPNSVDSYISILELIIQLWKDDN